jgi:iron complex outermembrane receptor protein
VVVGARVIKMDTIASGYNINTTAGTFAPVTFTGSRTFVLPSANLRYELIPNKLILRATATSVAAAPDLSKIAPSMSLNTVADRIAGNPNLKPYTAQQYDLGLEWYISRVNYLSATFWRKDIQGFIARPARKISAAPISPSRPITTAPPRSRSTGLKRALSMASTSCPAR